MPETNIDTTELRFNPYHVVIFILALLVPVFVLPGLLDNVFNTPKTLLMLVGASVMLAIYAITFLAGRPVPVSKVSTPKILLFLILLNFFSFFYTRNYYYTVVASVMNITGLLIFYFVSLYVDGKKAFCLMMIIALSGLLVSVETWLQFFNIFILFKGVRPGAMLMGTIGNSNFLGGYLIFPLFAMVGLIFLLKGKCRLIPLGLFIFMLSAFLFSRARAGWMGFFLSLPIFLLVMKRIHKISVAGYLRSHPKQVVAYVAVLSVLLMTLWSLAPKRFQSMMQFSHVTESETLRLRIQKYYRASFWLFKQNPLFGTGLWSYRNGVYKAQAEINRVDGNFFKNYPEPKPRRVHTDYLEILNDGGLIAAAALLLFFVMVMRHGWAVIRNEEIDSRDRVIAATAFCSLMAIMLAAFFFFPFRINSTLFMTVLMMGLVEGIYLRNHALIGATPAWKSEMRFLLIPIVLLLLTGLVWFGGIRPFVAEL
ncbi:MAG: O-antigen ligase family protein, partial [Desulfobacteraceae bacterium]